MTVIFQKNSRNYIRRLSILKERYIKVRNEEDQLKAELKALTRGMGNKEAIEKLKEHLAMYDKRILENIREQRELMSMPEPIKAVPVVEQKTDIRVVQNMLRF